ncbi:MAG: ABC-three component system middle component 1 [Bacteroidota bacterium]
MESFRINKIEKLEADIEKLFQVDDLIVGELSFGGTMPIIFVRFSSLDALAKTWKDLNSFLAAEFMTSIKDEYARWNFYIFYLSKENVERQLKYEIENNKFSSRKIVIENASSITEKEINLLISEHITNDNMQIGVENKQSSKFKKNASLAKILDKLSLNKKNDDDLQDTLDSIEKIYKNEI